jgi:hypothetical protein
MDPIITDDARTNELKKQVEALLDTISPEITMHDFRVVWGPTHSNLVFDICVPFGFSMKDDELVEVVSDKIHKLNSTYYAAITVDHDYVPKS